MKLVDDKNDNSAMVAYYQYNIHAKDVKKELIFSLVSRYIQQPYFNELRTNQQLGYVVHAAEYNPRLVQGIFFLIQSAQHSNEYCINASNKFFTDIKPDVDGFSDEDFEVQRASLHTIIAEQDINISKAHARSWKQIATHAYNFDEQEQQVKLLKEVTKKEFIDCFNDLFFGQNIRRVDFELNSASHGEENAKYSPINKEDAIYKAGRKEWETVDEFQQKIGYHDDFVIGDFKKSRD